MGQVKRGEFQARVCAKALRQEGTRREVWQGWKRAMGPVACSEQEKGRVLTCQAEKTHVGDNLHLGVT